MSISASDLHIVQSFKTANVVLNSTTVFITVLMMLHIFIIKKIEFEAKLKNYMTKIVLWLIFCGVLKAAFGIANNLVTDSEACKITLSFIKFSAMAEQLFSFLIALELFLIVKVQKIGQKRMMEPYFYKITFPLILVLSIIVSVLSSIDYYLPNTCVFNYNSIYSKGGTIFFLTVFIANMILFLLYFIFSQKFYRNSKQESQLTKIEELFFYILLFLTLGVFRATYYFTIPFQVTVVTLYIVIFISTLSSVLVPLLFAWNFGILAYYGNSIKNCFQSKQKKLENPENLENQEP